MKSIIIVCVLIIVGISTGSAQTSAFQTLKDKFAGREEVFSIGTSGLFARTVLLLAGEHEFKKTIRNIQRIRLITIPTATFQAEHVTVNGFKNILARNEYENLAQILDHGDEVSIYIKSGKRSHLNRYFVLVENEQEVVAMEIKGYIDPEHLLKQSHLSHNSQL